MVENLSSFEHTQNLPVRNAMNVIVYLKNQLDSEKLNRDKEFFVKFFCNALLEYRMSDGSFSTEKGYSVPGTGAGYDHCLGIEEGCMDVVHTPAAISNFISNFYNVTKPTVSEQFATELWNSILTEKYEFRNRSGKYLGWSEEKAASGEDDFEEYTSGNFVDTELISVNGRSTMEANITANPLDGNDKVLLLNKPSVGTGTLEGITLKTITHSSPETITMEFDVMFDNISSLYMSVKPGTAADLIFKPSGTQTAIIPRTGTASSMYLGSGVKTDSQNWQSIKIQYNPPYDGGLPYTEIYIGDSLVYIGNAYWDDENTEAPSNIKQVKFGFFEGGCGKVYLNNIKVSSKLKE